MAREFGFRSPWSRALGVAGAYALVAASYIVASSLYVGGLALNPEAAASVELAKGLGFVAITSLLLAVGLGWMFERRDRRRREFLRRSTDLARRQGESALHVAVGAIAHDMKNMIMALEGARDELHTTAPHGGPEVLEDMGQAIERLRTLTADLLDHARMVQQPTAVQEVDVAKLARETARIARVFARRSDCRIVVEATGSPYVRADALALEKALLNLVLNAVEATGGKGHVWVRVKPGNPVVLSVSDDGPGVSPDLRERVFEPFFTTKKTHGTGLGLAVVRHVVEGAGGRVDLLESETGGAEFRLSLPTRATGQRVESPPLQDTLSA